METSSPGKAARSGTAVIVRVGFANAGGAGPGSLVAVQWAGLRSGRWFSSGLAAGGDLPSSAAVRSVQRI
eukprot:349754-Chlamydomonas_euryale.AAC.1